jgi:hypothetical protein
MQRISCALALAALAACTDERTLSRIDVTPTAPTISMGASASFTATAVYSDTTTADVTELATWTSGTTSVLTVSDAAGTKGDAQAVAPGTARVTASYDGVSGFTDATVVAALVSIEVTPAAPTISHGSSTSFMAIGVYSDTTTADVTELATWTSDTTSVLTVSDAALTKGAAQAVAPGTARVTATYQGISGFTDATVVATLVSIGVTPAAPTISHGSSASFTATAVFSDTTTGDVTELATWTSDTTSVLTVSNAAGTKGDAQAVAPGTARVTATYQGSSGFTDATVVATLVSIEVTPAAPTISHGSSASFMATAAYSDTTTADVTELATWTSDTTSVLTVSDAAGTKGVAQAVAPGTARVTATYQGISGFTDATVVATLVSIGVTPAAPTISHGSSASFTATAVYSDTTTADVTELATWTSGTTSVLTVSDAAGTKGVAQAVAPGTARVTATYQGSSGFTDATVVATLVSIDVLPAAPTLFVGSTTPFTATAVYSDATTADVTELATWTSDTTSVLTVSDAAGTKGDAQALAPGAARVTATYQGVPGFTDATVVHEGGLVSIAILPVAPETVVGGTVELFAMGTYDDGTTSVLNDSATWSSTDPLIATVSNGTVTGEAAGSATITATVGFVDGSVTVNVSEFTMASLRIAPDLVLVSQGGSMPVQALALDAAGAEVDVTSAATWSSDTPGVATVAGGVVSGVSAGLAQVSAVHGTTATANVIVEAKELVALRLSSPASLGVGAGFTDQLRAIGLYSDWSERDVTDLAAWTSDLSLVVSVSDDADSKGVVYAASAGTANVTAAYGGLSATTTFTVAPRAVLWVTIDAVPSPLPVAASEQLHATAMYDDFTMEEVTDFAAWSSSDAAVVGVTPTGLITANQAGTAVVSSSYGGCSADSLLTVIDDVPTQLLVALGSSTLWEGGYTSTTVGLQYPDGRIWDVTGAAALSSDDVAVASVGGVGWSDSSVRAVGPGTANIQASYAGLTGAAPLAVSAIVSLTIAGPDEIPLGGTAPASATASTGSGSFVVTRTAEWSSSDPSLLTVSNSPGSKGSVTGIASGTATITVSLAGYTASKDVTVRGQVVSIAITPASAEVVENQVVALTATATLEDGTLDVTQWASWSSDSDVAYVSHGLVVGNHPGTSVVSAEMGGIIGNALVTVQPEPPLYVGILPASPDPVRLPVGATVRFSAYAEYQGSARHPQEGVTWTSTDPAVADFSTVTGHEGELTVFATGTTIIYATYDGAYSADREVHGDTLVSVPTTGSVTVPVGGSVGLPLVATFDGGSADLSPLVTWTTTDADVAIVDGGQLLGMGAGTAAVQTTIDGTGVSMDVTVDVPTISTLVNAPSPLAVGAEGPVEVIAALSNGDNISVTDVATLTAPASGILSVAGTTVTALTVGTEIVEASYLGHTGSGSVSVESGVAWLQIDPIEARAAVGTVTCPYVTSPGDPTRNVTELTSYATSNEAVAQLSGDCATATALGTALVTASYGGKSASMLVFVDPIEEPPQIVRLWGDDGPIHVYERAEYEAWAEPHTQPVTGAATWASSDTGVASVVGPGVFEGVAPGFATATALAGGLATTFWVRVLPASIVELEMQRWAIAVPAGASYPLTVTATYSDGVSGVDVTGAATFSCESTAVAELDALEPNLLHAVAPGFTHVQALVGTSVVQIPVTVF